MANVVDKKLVNLIEKFYVDIIDDFKEAELIIINDSKFSNFFKKKDYDRNIKKLRHCKKKCISLDVDSIKNIEQDPLKDRLIKNFERTRFAFNALCDAYIQLQLNLKEKSEGAKIKYKEYKEYHNKVVKCRDDMNAQLHELDIDYTDYTYDEDADPYEFL